MMGMQDFLTIANVLPCLGNIVHLGDKEKTTPLFHMMSNAGSLTLQTV